MDGHCATTRACASRAPVPTGKLHSARCAGVRRAKHSAATGLSAIAWCGPVLNVSLSHGLPAEARPAYSTYSAVCNSRSVLRNCVRRGHTPPSETVHQRDHHWRISFQGYFVVVTYSCAQNCSRVRPSGISAPVVTVPVTTGRVTGGAAGPVSARRPVNPRGLQA
jgi:hypothetical protein